MTEVKIPVPSDAKGRPIVKLSLKEPRGNWTDYYPYNFDTGASQPTDIALPFAPKWGSTTSSSTKDFTVYCRIEGWGNKEFKLTLRLQDKSHYSQFKSQPPPTRYPLCRVRDLLIAGYMSIVYNKEYTIMRDVGDPIPELNGTPKHVFPDMRRRSGTPTSGWQWYRGLMENPTTKKTYEDWFGCNTGDRRFIIRRTAVDKVGIKYPPLGSDDMADTTGSIHWMEASPDLYMQNVPITVDDRDSSARGGDPRNLCGGPNFLDKYNIVIWDKLCHLNIVGK